MQLVIAPIIPKSILQAGACESKAVQNGLLTRPNVSQRLWWADLITTAPLP